MVKQISCGTSRCGNRCKALSTQNMCLVNIILLVAEIIPDNWRGFSFWQRVFVFGDFVLFVAHFSMLLPATHSMCRGVVCLAHWIRTNVIGASLCMQSLHAQCVSGTFEIRWVSLPPTSQGLRFDYCTHVHRDDDAQTIYCAALVQCVVQGHWRAGDWTTILIQHPTFWLTSSITWATN